MKLTLKNDNFRIMQLTDLHFKVWQEGHPSLAFDYETVRLVEQLIQHAQPDLLVISGDLVDSPYIEDPFATQAHIIGWLNSLNIPVLVTYGNHDSECRTSRQRLNEGLASLNLQIEKENLTVLNDRVNFTVPIYGLNNQVVCQLYILDSGDYLSQFRLGEGQFDFSTQVEGQSIYAAISDEQNQWLEQIGQVNQAAGVRHDIMFCHIPLPEYKQVPMPFLEGVMEEGVCSADENSGTFATIQQATQIKFISVGHDHDNNFHGVYQGLHLCYGQPSGYGSYGKLPRGARIFDIHESGQVTTWLIDSTNLTKSEVRE
ncbi:metallophosphoesterase family protein [Vaginisenegalia massiliensis]|uniref:metallophosphoesterase family protein n=1 Tax=Vaginisenegalia massiliensis TaxID=2058294 RepID=UPI000F5484DE|nr:metallophosphoesterase family protein [Vaginisenegalia massiliensis]